MEANNDIIPYIGDISRADAFLLKDFALQSTNILEFGVGSSTQVLSKYSSGNMTSIDTDRLWIEKTRENLKLLGVKEPFFTMYSDWEPQTHRPYPIFDFIFDDGADHLRRDFGIKMFPYLKVGGYLALHDTRRPHDARNFAEILAQYHNEIDLVQMNVNHSNISVIRKKVTEPYDNWQITEKREPWQLGYGDPPVEFIDSLKVK